MPQSDSRPLLYGCLDLVLAGLYAYVFFVLVPGDSAVGTALAAVFTLAAVSAGLGSLSRRALGRRVAVVACAALLAACAVALLLVASSGAFLAGVYGGFGRAAVVLSLLVGALLVELVGLVPALQLKYLMTRAGRRAFERP